MEYKSRFFKEMEQSGEVPKDFKVGQAGDVSPAPMRKATDGTFTEVKTNDSRDERDSAVRQAYASRPAALSPYKAPVTEERLQGAYADLTVQGEKLKTKETELLGMQENVKKVQSQKQALDQLDYQIFVAGRGLKSLAEQYNTTQDDVTFQAYELAMGEYNKLVEQYQKDADAYQKAYKGVEGYNLALAEYDREVNLYNQKVSAYEENRNTYLEEHPEAKYAQASYEELGSAISDLEQQRSELLGADGPADWDKVNEVDNKIETLKNMQLARVGETQDKLWGSGFEEFLDRAGHANTAGMADWEEGMTEILRRADNAIYKTTAGILDAIGDITGGSLHKEWAEKIRNNLIPEHPGYTNQTELMLQALEGSGKIDGWIIKQFRSLGSMMMDIFMSGGANQMAGTTGSSYALGSKELMAVRATGSGMLDAAEKGYSPTEQVLTGIATGALEYAAESMFGGNPLYDSTDKGWVTSALEKVIKNPTVLRLLYSKGFGKMEEGVEELFTAFTQPLAEALITWQPPEMPTVAEAADAFAGGMFLSLVGSGVNTVSEEITGAGIRRRNALKKLGGVVKRSDAVQELLNEGLSANQRTDAYAMAKKLQKKLDAGKELTVTEIGKQIFANQKAINAGLLVDQEVEPDDRAPEGALKDPDHGFYGIRTAENEDGRQTYQLVQVEEDGSVNAVGEPVTDLLTAKLQAEVKGMNVRHIGTSESLKKSAEEVVESPDADEAKVEVFEDTEENSPEQEDQGILWAGSEQEADIEAGLIEPQEADLTHEQNPETNETEETGLQWAGNENMEGDAQNETAGRDLGRSGSGRYDGGNAVERAPGTGWKRTTGNLFGRAEEQSSIRAYVKAQEALSDAGKPSEVKLTTLRDLGFAEGSEEDVVRDVTNADIPAIKEAHELANRYGLNLVAVYGPTRAYGKDGKLHAITGAIKGNTIYARAGSNLMSLQEIILHEVFHYKKRHNPGLVKTLKNYILENYSEEDIRTMYGRYYELYQDIYGKTATDEKLVDLIWEEMLADAYAGYQRYADRPGPAAWKDDVRRMTPEGEENTTDQMDDGVRFSIYNKFYEQLDKWDGETVGFSFVVGETSLALQEAGIPKKQIRMDATKIVTLLKKHNGMTIEIVRKIPELLENPVVVIDSKADSNSRIVMGDLYDEHGRPVTVVLLLTPTSKKGNILDVIKVSSAEGRGHIKSLFRKEDGTPVRIRYTDKERIQSWLNVNRLQLPLHNLGSDPNNRISQTEEKSKQDLSTAGTDFRASAVPESSAGVTEKLTDEERKVVEQGFANRPERAPQKPLEDMSAQELSVPKSRFTSTPAMDKVGIKVDGSVTQYRATDMLISYEKAARQAEKALNDAIKRLNPTKEEMGLARLLVEGKLDPALLDAGRIDLNKLAELADYLAAKESFSEDLIYMRRYEINDKNARIAEDLLQDRPGFKPMIKKVPKATTAVFNYREMERICKQVFGDEHGQLVYDMMFRPAWVNGVELKRWQNKMLDRIRVFTDKTGESRELTVEEREYVQRLIEAKAIEAEMKKLDTTDRSKIAKAAEELRSTGNLTEVTEKYGLEEGYQQGLTQAYADYLSTMTVAETMDAVILENAVQAYQKVYNEIYDAYNDFLVSHGYKPIGFIKNYAPHFQKIETQAALRNALASLGAEKGPVSELPAEIAGRTADFKPNRQWNPHAQTRQGNKTDYDILAGFEQYISYAAEVFYHTDDIMRIRQAVNYLRRQHATDTIREAIEEAHAVQTKSIEAKQSYLAEKPNTIITADGVYDPYAINEVFEAYVRTLYESATPESMQKYGPLVAWMDNYANILAGKQSMADRAGESTAGRPWLRFGKALTSAFAKANVAGNLSSAINQMAQVPIIQAELGRYAEDALWDMVRGRLNKEGFNDLSDFLTDKRGVEKLSAGNWEKILTLMFKPAEMADRIVSQMAVRGMYNKMLAEGKTAEEALRLADDYGRRVMGSRQKGAKPTAFENKSPLWATLNMYQIEAVNTFEHLTKDFYGEEFRKVAKTKGKMAAYRFATIRTAYILVNTFLMNRLVEMITGGTPAPYDFLGWILSLVAGAYDEDEEDFMKIMIDNVIEKATGERPFDTVRLRDRDYTDGLDWAGAIEDVRYDVGNDIPLVNQGLQLLGLGDQTGVLVGVGDAVRSVGAGLKTLYDQIFKDEEETGLDWAGALPKAGMEIAEGITTFAPGGRQIMKTANGALALFRGGKYSGFGGSKRLQYPVDNQNPWNWVRGLLFGLPALDETDKYYIDGKSLSKQQTQKAKELEKYGVDIEQTYELYQEFADINSDQDKEYITGIEAKQQKRDAISAMDLDDEQKLEVYLQTVYAGNVKGKEKQREKYSALLASGVTWEQLTQLDNEYATFSEDLDDDGEADMDSLDRGIAKRNAIADMDLTDKQKLEVYDRYHLDRDADNYEEIRAEFEAMLNEGLFWNEITEAHNTYAMLNADETLTANQKATEYAIWTDEQRWTKSQREAVKERYMFWQMIPATAGKYESFTEQGWSSWQAKQLTEAQVEINGMGLTADKDANGKTIAGSKKEKLVRAIDDMDISDEMKDALYLSYNYSESGLDETPWH